MTTDIKLQTLGRRLLVATVLFLSSCRSDTPPAKEICILDGRGGGDCSEFDGSHRYRLPSEMVNYWSTNEADMKNFSAWCYGTTADNAGAAMTLISTEARNGAH